MSDEWCGWPVVDDQTGWEAAQQILTDAELSDGLPLVPPTRRRLEAMVAGVAGRGDSHGLDAAHVRRPHAQFRRLSMRHRRLPACGAADRAGRGRGDPRTGLQSSGHRHHDRHGLRGALRARRHRAPARRQRRHELPGPRQSRQCQHRPRAAAHHPQYRRRALRCRRHGDHGPARQIHALLRRAQRRPLPHPHRTPRPWRRCERDHRDGDLRHRRSPARRWRGRDARSHPLADRDSDAGRHRHVEHEPQERARRAGRSPAAGDGAEDRAPRRLGCRPRAALSVRPRSGRRARARRHPSHRHRRRRLQDELPADLGRRLADGDGRVAGASRSAS